MNKTFSILVMVALTAVVTPAADASTITFTASLTGAFEVPPNVSTATGFATVVLDDVADTVSVDMSFTGLIGGNASAAHIHCCVPPGVNGPVVIPLTGFPFATSGTYLNTFTGVSAATIAGMESGLAYINIHDAVFPGGEIRGQLTAVPEPATLLLFGPGLAAIVARRRFTKRK